jgi:murein DD-endopeptidase MepM/ murein hydrolase activator NlpD
VTTSYSHLQRIDPALEPGVEVHRDQVIGWAGNSGTSHAYGQDGWGELHFELRINGEPVGIGMPAGEAAALYRRYLGAQP